MEKIKLYIVLSLSLIIGLLIMTTVLADVIPIPIIKNSKATCMQNATNIKNLYNIKQYGLIPDFGETTKQAYGEYYDFDKTGNEELQQLDFDGILFFAEEPLLITILFKHF